ncbi:O-antigen ligase family protein [Ruminococcus albus]|uniref:O-antigen polymerase n=1 Tax=Ruminococcus albus 8 TaxID=246199 RepID=E9SDF6_RUMAL|nr:O-antigen ligase family protein [Ruminococcus albus]EGC02589.1 O-antigen polymerase [Ruminococcus albus 8]MCC3350153.1 O-antigen ligase family protein [Ruminococcus albus 8]
MNREDLLDFNFDWRDEETFKQALKDSNLSEKEKLRLRDERMRRLELEELRAENSDYDDYDYDDDDEELEEPQPEENEVTDGKEKNDKKDRKSKKGKDPDGLIVAIKGDYPMRKTFVALLMCIFTAILPYVSYMHSQPGSELTEKYFTFENGYITDWFLFQKEFFVVIAAVILCGIFLVEEFFVEKHWKDIPLRKKNMRLPLVLTGLYALLLIISGIASEHKELVMMGVVKQYEGLLGVLGYLIIFLAAINYFCDTKSLKRFSWAMIITTLAASIFAVMEYMGYPLQSTEFMAHLIAPADKYEVARSLHSTSSNVHITFFNSNYFGSFCGLMFPLTAALGLGSKNIAMKILGLTAAAGIAVGAVLSNSSGGLYSVAGSGAILFIIYLIYWCRGTIRRVPALIAFVCAAAVCAAGMFYMVNYNDGFRKRFTEVVNNGSSSKTTVEEKRAKLAADHFVLKEICQDGSKLVLDDYSGNTVTVEGYLADSGINAVRFYDTEGEPLDTYVDDDKCYCFTDDRYLNCNFKFSVSDKLYIDLGYEKKLVFQYEDEKFKPYVHSLYTMEEINTYKGPEFFKKDLSAFTGRFFIWGSTISMLDDCILIGKGSGNYVTYFPQYDYVSLLEVYDTPAMVVNKPHNWYLGVAVDSGVISLIVLLTLLGAFLVKGFKAVILHPVQDRFTHLRLGIFVSVIAFMVVGIVNDSYVCVSPVFWFIFGVGWYSVSGNKVIETD